MGLLDLMKKKKEKKKESNVDLNWSFEEELDKLEDSETNRRLNEIAREEALNLERQFKLKQFNEEFGKTYDEVKSWIAFDSMGIKSEKLDKLNNLVNDFFKDESITIDKMDFLLPFIFEKANRNITSSEEAQVLNSSRMRYGDDFAKVVLFIYREILINLYGAAKLEETADSILLDLYAEAVVVENNKKNNNKNVK